MSTQMIERAAGRPVKRSAADLEALFPGRYLSVTSFKRDGSGVATPLWFVAGDNRLYALTDLHSGKVKRIRRHPEVLVAPCRATGRLRAAPVTAQAEILTSEEDLERVQRRLRKRYRITYPVVMLGYRLGRRLRGDQAVADGAALAITVGAAAPQPR